jgi:hypothetical protein
MTYRTRYKLTLIAAAFLARDLFDYGFCGGMGVEAPIGNNANVSLGFRYNHGQGNMQADTRSIPLYNRSLNFNIGISQGF